MFEEFRNRMQMAGSNIREANRNQSIKIMENGFTNSQAARTVIVNGIQREARIISDSKTTARGGNGNFVIQFRDGFNPQAGTYVQIPGIDGGLDTWLILYESDSIYFPKHIIKKCNYLLKWKNSRGEIVERWSVFNDNTRIVDGERKGASNKVTLPFHSTPLILPCDSETINIRMDKRFLVDNANVEDNPDAWVVTNRNVISKTFSDFEGVVELSLSHQQFNHNTDNKELMIADYYKDYDNPEDVDITSELTCRINYTGTSDIKMGTPYKSYTAEFYRNGVLDNTVTADWDLVIPEANEEHFTYEETGNIMRIKCRFNSLLIGSHIRLIATNDDFGCSAELPIEVVSSI